MRIKYFRVPVRIIVLYTVNSESRYVFEYRALPGSAMGHPLRDSQGGKHRRLKIKVIYFEIDGL